MYAFPFVSHPPNEVNIDCIKSAISLFMIKTQRQSEKERENEMYGDKRKTTVTEWNNVYSVAKCCLAATQKLGSVRLWWNINSARNTMPTIVLVDVFVLNTRKMTWMVNKRTSHELSQIEDTCCRCHRRRCCRNFCKIEANQKKMMMAKKKENSQAKEQQWRILTFVLFVLENALEHFSILDLFIFFSQLAAVRRRINWESEGEREQEKRTNHIISVCAKNKNMNLNKDLQRRSCETKRQTKKSTWNKVDANGEQ